MIVWHVCSTTKLDKYRRTGSINPPVRAWENIEDDAPKLEGHFNQARVLQTRYKLDSF